MGKLRPGRHKDVKPCTISWFQISRLRQTRNPGLNAPTLYCHLPQSLLAPSRPLACPVSLGKCFLLCLLKSYPSSRYCLLSHSGLVRCPVSPWPLELWCHFRYSQNWDSSKGWNLPSSGKGCVSLGLSLQTEIFGKTEPVFSAICSPTPPNHTA